MIFLQEAVELSPEDARFAYVYAIALNSTGRSQDALEIQEQANARQLLGTGNRPFPIPLVARVARQQREGEDTT